MKIRTNRPQSHLASLIATLLLCSSLNTWGLSSLPGEFPHQEDICSADPDKELQRALSAASMKQPIVHSMAINGEIQWTRLSPATATLHPGDVVTLIGEHLGHGTDTDFSKIMIGNARILETDLRMFEQKLATQDQVNYETTNQVDEWPSNILSWQPNEVSFRVPDHVDAGPIRLQVQKRTGANASLYHSEENHLVIDAQTARIIDDDFRHECDVVSKVSQPLAIEPIPVSIDNPEYDNLVDKGRAIFWSWDYNIGVAHWVRNLDWPAIFNYKAKDPIEGGYADPRKLFGAYKTVSGQVPSEAIDDVYFATYPMPTPIPGFLTLAPAKLSGNTRNTGWVGYRYAEGNAPYSGPGEFIGFNCASCHGYQISYQQPNGEQATKVFPGLPNPEWSMKWTVLQTPLKKFKGIYEQEDGPEWKSGKKAIAKDMLIYHLPAGAGEHNMVRLNGEGSHTDNDYQFSPIAIPSVTNYMSIRRSLSHTESYVGFEGSYIHSEEPDGAQGAMSKEALEQLTAYMTQLDSDDSTLINLGLYRWLNQNNLLTGQAGAGISEGEFLATEWQAYPAINAAVSRGKALFERDCGECHTDRLGAHTNEQMIPLNEVGRFFSPTIYQKEMQSIRVSFLRNVYWVQSRGLLSDGHVRNIEDLISPDRCNTSSDLYKQYYTLHAAARPEPGSADQPITHPDLNRKGDVFRVPKSRYWTKLDKGYKRNRFIERHKYFTQVPWDNKHYYWDYQQMRAEFGPDEMGTDTPIGMPATPHPWCAQSGTNQSELNDLVQYILTL